MVSKVFACAIALFIQGISAQAIGNFAPMSNMAAAEALAFGPGVHGPNAMPYPAVPFETIPTPIPCGFGLTLAELTANGGGFAVTSTSPITPNGVTVQADNLMFEGPLAVSGTMPFLGSVALEGPLPAAGQGAVAYGCGNGNVGIISEELPGASLPGPIGSGAMSPMGPNPMSGYMGPRGPYGPMY